MKKIVFALSAVCAVTMATPATAAVVTVCSNGSGCEQNDSLVNLVDGTGITTAVGSVDGATVNITATGVDGSSALTAANGQATVSMTSGSLINSLTFALTGGSTFGSAEFNLLSGDPKSFTVSACTSLSCGPGQGDQITLTNANGSNWFDILYTGAAYTSVTITANDPTAGFSTFKQLRFDHVAAVPEPATWAMMLLGFGAIGVSMRRRKTVLAQVA